MGIFFYNYYLLRPPCHMQYSKVMVERQNLKTKYLPFAHFQLEQEKPFVIIIK